MLVGPPRDFRCPHCGALYKLVRMPKFEPNRLDYDPVLCIQCSRLLSPNVFMTQRPPNKNTNAENRT
jgi:NAD-dependent SIR2 family protein deacetylase